MSYFTSVTRNNYQIKIPLEFRGFKIKKPCGEGAFSSVVKVKDTNTKKAYAAKIIPKKGIKDQSKVKDMIDNEISILQKANHTNIIQLYEIIELTTKDDSFIILIEEFCQNGTLSDYASTSGFKNEREKIQIFRGIIESLHHLHSLGIAHCDIKPDNVLLDANNVPKLCDFNLSRFVDKSCYSDRPGTQAYAAPEIFKFERVNFLRADIWSLGIMIFSVVENKYPYKNDEDGRKGLLFINSSDKKLNAFTKRCLKVNPSKRATAAQLLSDKYLSLDDEINEDYAGDAAMISKIKQEAEVKPKTSPNLANAKAIKRGEVIFSNDDLPPLLDDNGDDIDSEINDDIFEIIYGYRRSSLDLENSHTKVDDGYTETTVYKRKSTDSSELNSRNSNNNNNSELEVSHASGLHRFDEQQKNSEIDTSNRHLNDNDNSMHAAASPQNVASSSGNLGGGGGLDVQSDSLTFSVILELGYDFRLQCDSETSQADDLDEDEIEGAQYDDFGDYEIERIESRICDSIVKLKYERKRKPKKKVPNTKRKEKKDWMDEPYEE